MKQLLQIYQLHIHNVNLPFLLIPKVLILDLETVEYTEPLECVCKFLCTECALCFLVAQSVSQLA